MKKIFHVVYRSLIFYRRPVFYQVLIIVLLSAVITGSLLVGSSVKASLRRSSSQRLGNAGIVISSGTRFFKPDLVQRIKESSRISITGIIDLSGFCQALNSQKGAFNTHIYGVTKDFFVFQGLETMDIKPGETFINKKLADYIGIKQGEDLIIRYSEPTDIPSDAPFAPSPNIRSVVMKVTRIINPEMGGNFSLSISQITPMNIFMNVADVTENSDKELKLNRILINKDSKNTTDSVTQYFTNIIQLSDIGLRLRRSQKTGESELISNRVFIDEAILKEVVKLIPVSAPVLTYLGNSFDSGMKSTPYSFVSAIPSSLYTDIPNGNQIVINKWMAEDLSVKEGDSIKMSWYSPDSLNTLKVKSSQFLIKRIVEMDGIWSDSLLMPDFPGIAGKESCSNWDAGIPIKMHSIRTKDEDYWNRYRGTPKAFICYEKGKELWGNNFGPATSIRFPSGLTEKEIMKALNRSIDPFTSGFSLADMQTESLKASDESVDFGTLFLSLGFFLILASIVLLSFASSLYFDSKKDQINTLYALGFKNNWIIRLMIFESGLISLAGCAIGAFTGYFADILITMALNSVWSGAVQTDTLKAYFSLTPIITGFVLTFIVVSAMMMLKIRRYLLRLHKKKRVTVKSHSGKSDLMILVLLTILTISLFGLSLFTDEKLLYSFASGAMLLITLVLYFRQYFMRAKNSPHEFKNRNQLSRLHYSFNPSTAITPILFIAAGIFTVFITGANKLDSGEGFSSRSGGTGGYLLWSESTIPVKEDLNNSSSRKSLGLDDTDLSGMRFVQMKRQSGNDASCLNLNHIKVPPILGVDPSVFITDKSFSFSTEIKSKTVNNPWQYLKLPPGNNIIYGVADQTVLEWGLKLKPGDTLVIRAENGSPLRIIMAAGLQSSVFQGNVLIGSENFSKFFPSVSGSSIMLVDGEQKSSDLFKTTLNDRLENYGIHIEKTTDRLVSFNSVTNTYLSVFAVFGALGMLIGVIGLGFVLLKNYSQRKQEFALMMAVGFPIKNIRKMIFSEQLLVLIAGISTGIVSAIIATLPSIKNNYSIPWFLIGSMILLILATGLAALLISLRSVTKDSLITSLKKE